MRNFLTPLDYELHSSSKTSTEFVGRFFMDRHLQTVPLTLHGCLDIIIEVFKVPHLFNILMYDVKHYIIRQLTSFVVLKHQTVIQN